MIKQEIDNKRIFSFINRLIHKWRPNSRAGAKRNIHAHYDLGNNFYSLWLDKSMTYSSALFKDSQTDLRAAQQKNIAPLPKQLICKLTIMFSKLVAAGAGLPNLQRVRLVAASPASPFPGAVEICPHPYRQCRFARQG